MNLEDRDRLLMRYLDGNLSEFEAGELHRLLAADADARRWLREIAMQAVSLADLARAEELTAPQPIRPRPVAAGRLSKAILVLAGGAALLIAMTTAWLWRDQAEAVTLVEVAGAVSWTAEGGRPEPGLQSGVTLCGGTLSVEGAASSAHLVFRDGSTITLNGDSEMSLPSDGGKRLLLREGTLSADVRAQPADRPMLVRTPTAEIEVLGTRFSVSAQPAETAISVDAGQVRLWRLADERSIDVNRGQAASASLDVAEPMKATPLPRAPRRFRQTFEQPPLSNWRGRWVAADAHGPGRLQNLPDFSHRRRDGTPSAAYTVSMRDRLGMIATVSPDSILRVRFRTADPRPVLVLVGLHEPTGWFAGNFQTVIKPGTIQADADGWYTWEAPLSALEASSPKGARIPAAGRVFLVYLACYAPKIQLEVAELAIEPRGAAAMRSVTKEPSK